MGYQITYDANIGAIPFASGTYVNMSVSSTAGRSITGTRSFYVTANYNGYFKAHFITPTSTPAVSVWTYPGWMSTDYNQTNYIYLYTTSGHHVSARWNRTTETYDLYVQNDLVASGEPDQLGGAMLCNLRLYGTIANSGSLTLKLNGLVIAEYSGDTLPDGSDAEIEYVQFGISNNQANNTTQAYYSSISLNDGGTDPGDRRAHVLMPEDDSSVQWTPSTAEVENWTMVDEVPPSDTDYVETATNGHKDLLILQDFSGASRTISGVTKFVRAWKTTADSQSLKNGIKAGSTEDSTEHTLDTSARYYFHPIEDNPDDSAPWEDGDIDDLLSLHEAVIP